MKNKILLSFFMAVFCLSSCSFFNSIEESVSPDPIESQVTETTFDKTGPHFQNNVLNVFIGDSVYLPLKINPKDVQANVSITWEYDSSYINAKTDNFGVIIEGKKAGSTWIKASCNGIVATCLISVLSLGDEIYNYQYIFSNDSVCEIKTNTSYTVTASLYGGSIADMEDFEWQIKDSSIASISYARNNCIITAKKPGSTQLTCKHPNAEYDYTFVIFCYTDQLTVPYLTTTTNVLTIDKNTVSSTKVYAELKNPYSSDYQKGYKWELADEISKSVISITGNRTECNIVPLKNGIAKIKVSHEQCEYPLYIYVRVTTVVKNSYIDVSQSTIIVDGSENPYSVTAQIKNFEGYVNNEDFVWTIDNPSEAAKLMSHSSVGNTFSVYGLKNGKVGVTISHPLSEYSRKIVFIMQNQIGSAIDSSMYITTTQNYVQTQVGKEPTKISIRLVGGKDGVDNIGDDKTNFTWWIEGGNNNGIIEVQNVTGVVKNLSSRVAAALTGESCPAEIQINPLKEGTAKIVVSHPRCLYDTEIKVKVYGKDAVVNPVVLTTEDSVIRLLNGSSINVTASLRNAEEGMENNITWSSADDSVIKVNPSAGPTAVFSAVGTGSNQTYVTVHLDEALADKKILVLSADTQLDLDKMKGIYADSTYLRISSGETKEIHIDSFGLAVSDRVTWSTEDSSKLIVNGVPSSENCSYANVNGIADGKTTVTASVPGCEPVVFDVTVLPKGVSSEIFDESAAYLTTSQNSVLVEDTETTVGLSINGVNISPEDLNLYTTWAMNDETDGNGSVFELYGSGPDVQIKANRPGKTRIRVANKKAENTLDIYAKCGELYEWVDEPIVYITTENDVVNIMNGESITIGCALANSSQTGAFGWSLKNGADVIDIVGLTGGTCNITAKNAGQAIIECTNTLAEGISKEILVNVANSKDELNGFTYLTTSNNVVNISQGSNLTVSVDVVNSTTPIISGYNWQIDPASIKNDICTVSNSGNIAVIYGNHVGTSKISVTNSYCDFPLEIIVNVVDPIAAAKNPYISCQSVVTATIGKPNIRLTAELVGGNESDNNNFTWSIVDDSIAKIYPSNDVCEIKALKEGVTIINISHPKTGGVVRKVMLICEAQMVTNCYITTTESIIKMSPSDSERTISASLVNGSADDVYDFKWWADSYDKININYTNEYCVVKPISTGTVTLHVSHPKAPNTKDIILYISQYSDFAFSEKSQIVYTGGDNVFVTMEVPATTTECEVSYEVTKSSTTDVCTVYGNSTACIIVPGKNPGSATITASLQTKGGIVQAQAEMLVVNQAKDATAPYLSVEGSTIRNLAVNETTVLKGGIAGNGINDGDASGIVWTITEPNKICFMNMPGNTARGSSVSIKALNPGSTTIKLSHSKANTITLYVTVTGTSDPRISLNYSENTIFIGEEPFKLTATVTNDNGSEIIWNNSDDSVINLNAKNKQASITALKVGTSVIKCAFKDNPGSEQTCTVTVAEAEKLTLFTWADGETARTTKLGLDSIALYPGESKAIHYETSPARTELDNTASYISDNNYFSFQNLGYVSSFKMGNNTYSADPEYGTIILTAKAVTSTTPIGLSFKCKNGMSASFTATNDYGYYFNIDRSAIALNPASVCTGKKNDSLAVKYQIKPACSKIEVNVGPAAGLKIVNADNTEVSHVVRNGDCIYTITGHSLPDNETGIAEGTIYFAATNEIYNNNVTIVAINDNVVSSNGVLGQPKSFSPKNISFDITYKEHTFTTSITKLNGSKFSHYDAATNCLYIGDGEDIKVTLVPKESYSTFKTTVTFKPSGSGASTTPLNEYFKNKNNNLTLGNSLLLTAPASTQTVSNSEGLYFNFSHTYDFNLANGFWNVVEGDANKQLENMNTTARVLEYVGNIEVKCFLGNDSSYTHKIPVYVAVRNCPAKN